MEVEEALKVKHSHSVRREHPGQGVRNSATNAWNANLLRRRRTLLDVFVAVATAHSRLETRQDASINRST